MIRVFLSLSRRTPTSNKSIFGENARQPRTAHKTIIYRNGPEIRSPIDWVLRAASSLFFWVECSALQSVCVCVILLFARTICGTNRRVLKLTCAQIWPRGTWSNGPLGQHGPRGGGNKRDQSSGKVNSKSARLEVRFFGYCFLFWWKYYYKYYLGLFYQSEMFDLVLIIRDNNAQKTSVKLNFT